MAEKKGWLMKRVTSGDIHCYPRGDHLKHEPTRWCLCGPRFEADGQITTDALDSERVVVIHEAYDGRE